MSEQEFNERWWRDAERDAIHAAAAQWFTRLQDPQASIEVTLAWQRWMGEDAKNAQAFERLEEVWNTLSDVSPLPVASALADADPYDGTTPLGDYKPPSFARRHRMALAIAASVLLATTLLAWVLSRENSGALSRPATEGLFSFADAWQARLRGVGPEIMRTAIGENRSVRLKDGSRIMLGGGTELEIDLRDDVRHLSLQRGEAFFKVAKDASRPFVVRAGDTAVTAVGTEFNIRRGGDRVIVAVVEGRVVVERSSRLVPVALLQEFRPKLAPVRVDAGQQTVVDGGSIESATELTDPGSATAWQSGRLAYQGEPLRYVLADVNRYATTPIVLEDDSIGSLSITGTVASDNVGEWVASLERAFGLVAVQDSGRVVLKRVHAP